MIGQKKISKILFYISSCPNRCGNNIHPMSSGAMKKIYNGLEIACIKCKKIVTLIDL